MPGPPVSPLIGALREGQHYSEWRTDRAEPIVNERGGVNDLTVLMHAVHKEQPARFALSSTPVPISTDRRSLWSRYPLRLA